MINHGILELGTPILLAAMLIDQPLQESVRVSLKPRDPLLEPSVVDPPKDQQEITRIGSIADALYFLDWDPEFPRLVIVPRLISPAIIIILMLNVSSVSTYFISTLE